MLESGYKISDLPVIPITGENCPQKDKIAVDDTYVLGYSHTVYGIKYNRNNYRIPLVDLRDDIKGYIGIESLIKPWTVSTKFWHGNWENDSSKNKSYVYVWQDSDKNNLYYSPDKFSDLENSYYIICDAPYPFETEDLHNRDNGEIVPGTNTEGEPYPSVNVPLAAADPYPESRKMVLKTYVDERLSGKRLVEVTPEFRIRDYDCTYVIRAEELKKAEAENAPVKIIISYPEQAEERVKHNSLVFSLLIEGEANEEGSQDGYVDYISALTNNVEWEIRDSNGEKKELIWVNKDSEHKPLIPDVSASDLYGLSKYMIFNFRTFTNEIKNYDKLDIVDGTEQKVGEYTVADYSVYAVCENLVFSGDSHKDSYISSDNTINIQTVDELFKTTIDITSNLSFGSSDETLLITNEPKNHFDIVSNLAFQSANGSINISKITPNLINLETTPAKPTILEELPVDDGENTYILDFSNSKNKAYYTYAKDFTLNISCENLEEDETVSTIVYLNTLWNDTDTQITSTNIRWAMSQYDISPVFKPGRLYCIKFTHVPQQALYNESIGEMPTYGSILWHYYIAAYPSCKGTLKDTFTFEDGLLTLNWPLKQCGESAYKTITTDFYSSYLARNEIVNITGNVPELVSAQRMFINGTNIVSCNFNNLNKLENGIGMFNNTGLTHWDIQLPKLKFGAQMFWSVKITSWNINLPLLTDGRVMFYNSTISSFTGELPNLTNGNGMFEYCPLTEWNVELPKLTNAKFMFDGSNLSSWSTKLPEVIDGGGLFYNNRHMTSCTIDAPNMTNAQDILSFAVIVNKRPNTMLTDLILNVPKLSQVLLNNTYNTPYSFGELQALTNISIISGGLNSVETFAFSANANNLTYQSMLNVANALPSYESGTHTYTCPINETTEEERTNITNIVEAKGWTMNFV